VSLTKEEKFQFDTVQHNLQLALDDIKRLTARLDILEGKQPAPKRIACTALDMVAPVITPAPAPKPAPPVVIPELDFSQMIPTGHRR
jgi:hypothetical protein